MSEHDPLCEPPGNMDDLNCCCEFVARIRADERAKFKPYVISGAVQRVEALPHSLECVTRDANYRRPCNCLRGDALDAIKGES